MQVVEIQTLHIDLFFSLTAKIMNKFDFRPLFKSHQRWSTSDDQSHKKKQQPFHMHKKFCCTTELELLICLFVWVCVCVHISMYVRNIVLMYVDESCTYVCGWMSLLLSLNLALMKPSMIRDLPSTTTNFNLRNIWDTSLGLSRLNLWIMFPRDIVSLFRQE